MPSKRWAVVLSSDAIGLGAVRSLHQGGVPTIVIALHSWEPVRFSRYAEKRLVRQSGNVEDALLEALFRIKKARRPVLIPTSDFLVQFVAKHRSALSNHFRCCIPPNEVVELVLDKAKDTQLLPEFQIPLPKTVPNLSLTPGQLVRKLGLPLIVKPRSYTDKKALGWRNVVLHTAEDLEEFCRNHRSAFGRVIAQELIPGDDEALWECICVFDGNSDLISAFTFRKLRTVPAHYGHTSYGRSERNDEITDLARTLGKKLNYVGPADIDLKYDCRDGRYKYLELNPRLGLCNYFATRCGVNLVLDAYRLACGEEVDPQAAVQTEGMTFLAALEDVGGRLHDGDSLPRVLFDLLGALRRNPVGAYFSWDDVWPAPSAIFRICFRLLETAASGRLAFPFTHDYGKRRRRTSFLSVLAKARERARIPGLTGQAGPACKAEIPAAGPSAKDWFPVP